MRRAAFLVAGWLLAGCQPASNICGEHTQPISEPDGGEYRCVAAEDCPRPSNVFVCVTRGAPEDECVSCTDTRCIHHVPEPCQ